MSGEQPRVELRDVGAVGDAEDGDLIDSDRLTHRVDVLGRVLAREKVARRPELDRAHTDELLQVLRRRRRSGAIEGARLPRPTLIEDDQVARAQSGSEHARKIVGERCRSLSGPTGKSEQRPVGVGHGGRLPHHMQSDRLPDQRRHGPAAVDRDRHRPTIEAARRGAGQEASRYRSLSQCRNSESNGNGGGKEGEKQASPPAADANAPSETHASFLSRRTAVPRNNTPDNTLSRSARREARAPAQAVTVCCRIWSSAHAPRSRARCRCSRLLGGTTRARSRSQVERDRQ